ncbi:PREDICTED: general odorant-binding protein 72-like isoform X1 [Polistes canadensis]|uniref:general odorant-binding protein 72-like isoform X1 n=1 Tax=Polistes canadensis TaxID=91411 RepID=UPI000718EAF0|nr:PREDICTED: general odorant-binding protein 72-like isoform X1 [Polistes canadensis]
MSSINRNLFKRFVLTIFILGCVLERFRLIDGAMTLEQMQKTAIGIRNSCITKTGVKTELVDGLKTGQFPEDHDLQCYTQCVMKTIRTFKNQKVDVDMVIKQVEMMMPVDMQDAMKASAKKCGALEPADDICVTAFNYVKCNYNENPDIFFFP